MYMCVCEWIANLRTQTFVGIFCLLKFLKCNLILNHLLCNNFEFSHQFRLKIYLYVFLKTFNQVPTRV